MDEFRVVVEYVKELCWMMATSGAVCCDAVEETPQNRDSLIFIGKIREESDGYFTNLDDIMGCVIVQQSAMMLRRWRYYVCRE